MNPDAAGRGDLVVPRRWIVIGAVAAGVTVLVAVAAVVIGRELIGSTAPPPKPPAPAEPPGFVRFHDAGAKFSIAHPSTWVRRTPPEPDVRLLAELESASMLVRVANLPIKVSPENVGAAKQITDSLVNTARNLKLLRAPAQVNLGGLPGYLYLYTFRSPAGHTDAHAHYFLFRGEEMITIVFQATPADNFVGLAPLFDQIATTLRSQPA